MTVIEKIKKIAKYTVNTLAIINALLEGLAPIWGIPYADEISKTLIVVIGAISAGLLGQKGYAKIHK